MLIKTTVWDKEDHYILITFNSPGRNNYSKLASPKITKIYKIQKDRRIRNTVKSAIVLGDFKPSLSIIVGQADKKKLVKI